MGFLADIIFFGLVVFFAPYILVTMLCMVAASFIVNTFYLPLLFMALSSFGIAGFLYPFSEVDNSRPFVSVVEWAAQSHIFGLSMPFVFVNIGGLLLFASVSKKIFSSRTPAN